MATSTPGTTSREELAGFVDTYLDALTARDPSRLPLAPGAKHTENGQAIPLGRGLWGSATPEPPVKRAVTVADTTTGEVGFFGAASEHGEGVLLSLRLKVEGGGISEMESLVVRQGNSLFGLFGYDTMGEPRPHFDAPIDPAARGSREELVSVANRYFDGIEHNDGSIIPVQPGAVRFENGVQTVRRPAPRDAGFPEGARMEIDEQISTGYFEYISEIRDRRYPVIDEERGLVLGIVFFEHPGHLTSVEVKGVGTVELRPFARRPSSALIFELFKVESGRITAVEAMLDMFPFGMRSGWD
ncbi:MAG: hypothetical protein J2P59_03130 [Acidimicrobiales bacterium]|nr:hypothetical protein [Acidimicrobiales bacterium]MBO0886942.1 hypothetical protein [Acidimicrobiales bacterium]